MNIKGVDKVAIARTGLNYTLRRSLPRCPGSAHPPRPVPTYLGLRVAGQRARTLPPSLAPSPPLTPCWIRFIPLVAFLSCGFLASAVPSSSSSSPYSYHSFSALSPRYIHTPGAAPPFSRPRTRLNSPVAHSSFPRHAVRPTTPPGKETRTSQDRSHRYGYT